MKTMSYRKFKNEIIDRNDGQRMTNYESAKIEAKELGVSAEFLCKTWYEEEMDQMNRE